jgi:hypothetical protein
LLVGPPPVRKGPASGQPARAVPQAGPVVLGWAAYQQGERKTGRTWGTCHPAPRGMRLTPFRSFLPSRQSHCCKGRRISHLEIWCMVSSSSVLACPRPAPAPAACCTSDLGPTTGGRARYPVSNSIQRSEQRATMAVISCRYSGRGLGLKLMLKRPARWGWLGWPLNARGRLNQGRCRAPPSRPAPPGAAVGQGVGWGPRGSPPDPAHLGPICEKSRFQDVKPTLLHIQALTNCG